MSVRQCSTEMTARETRPKSRTEQKEKYRRKATMDALALLGVSRKAK